MRVGKRYMPGWPQDLEMLQAKSLIADVFNGLPRCDNPALAQRSKLHS